MEEKKLRKILKKRIHSLPQKIRWVWSISGRWLFIWYYFTIHWR